MSTSAKPFRLACLMSYFYLRKCPQRRLEQILTLPDIDILMDSGGFTAKNIGEEINLDEYIDFIKHYGKRLFGYMALDILGDPKGSDRNLRKMQKAGCQPIPIHVRGDEQKRMDELFKMSDYVALGGLRLPKRTICPPSYVHQKMIWAKGRKVHWLGYSNLGLAQRFKPFSCDVVSWAAGHMWGRLDIYLGKGRWKKTTFKDLQKKDVRSLDSDTILYLKSLGFEADQFLNKDYWHRNVRKGIPVHQNITIISNAFSHVGHARDVINRFGVKIFLACEPSNDDFDCIYACKKLLDRGQTPSTGEFKHQDLWDQIDNKTLKAK